MNDFEKMCKNLQYAKRCGCSMCKSDNEYVCAMSAVKNYVREDKKKLLKLKAEEEQGDYNSYISLMISMSSLFVCTINFVFFIMVEVCREDDLFLTLYGFALLLFLMGGCMAFLIFQKKYRAVGKWRGYIKVAIQELEPELEEK